MTTRISRLTLAACALLATLTSPALVPNTATAAPVHPTLPWSSLTLVDQVDCGNPSDPHMAADFVESTAGVSTVQTILGRSARVLPQVSGTTSRYFAYKIGR